MLFLNLLVLLCTKPVSSFALYEFKSAGYRYSRVRYT
jgi:hypothetical protein